MIDVIFKLMPGKTLIDVASEVNGLWGTAAQDPENAQIELLLPSVNTPVTYFDGVGYARARMPQEHAQALQDLMDGDPRFGGYVPQTAEVVAIQWDGPAPYLLGETAILDEDLNPIQVPDTYDGEGNPLTYKDAMTEVYVGIIA